MYPRFQESKVVPSLLFPLCNSYRILSKVHIEITTNIKYNKRVYSILKHIIST